jgi:hypothetical protein
MAGYVDLVRRQAAERRAGVNVLTERRQKLFSAEVAADPVGGPAAHRNSTAIARSLRLQPENGIPPPELGTKNTRYKEMEKQAARLVAELERSDREWRQCVAKLEKRCALLEHDNAQLRFALHEAECQPPDSFTSGRASARAEYERESVAGLRIDQPPSAEQHAHTLVDAGSTWESEWSAFREFNARAAAVRAAQHLSAELTSAGRQTLQEPLARLRSRSELLEEFESLRLAANQAADTTTAARARGASEGASRTAAPQF